MTDYTGAIRRLGKGYIQIAPFYGFWLTDEQYEYISTHYKVGDTITLTSDTITGFVVEIKENDHERSTRKVPDD